MSTLGTTVTFGKRQKLTFRSEGTLNTWRPEAGPGIYAITYKRDAEGKPKAHTVLYFGDTDNFTVQAPSIKQDFQQWCKEHGTDTELFVFCHPMPSSSKYERSNLTHQLIMEYDPQANH